FDGATFSGGTVFFDGATFSPSSTVSFDGARFSGGIVAFDGATFSGGTVSLRSVLSWVEPPTFTPRVLDDPPEGLLLPAPTTG
ncbi:hypothetical protein GT352_33820, partial [Streptomyces sp. SID1046]|uniref:pentapeptide repeat-containing protein n=1 Tax=Streptomyces sp. SID1046 TaxID=2690249 RepID=UPI0013942800